jgi:hypothetical protein
VQRLQQPRRIFATANCFLALNVCRGVLPKQYFPAWGRSLLEQRLYTPTKEGLVAGRATNESNFRYFDSRCAGGDRPAYNCQQ